MTCREGGAALSVLALVSALAAGVVSAQSLGEVARQEEARRKAVAAPGKVYTNESLRQDSLPPATSAATPPPGAGMPPPDAAGTEPKKDEAYWRQRIQAERDALSRAETFAEALQSRINALTTDFTARDDPAQRAVIATDRQKALAELDRVRREIAEHGREIAAIQEEARRAGVPPGWLR